MGRRCSPALLHQASRSTQPAHHHRNHETRVTHAIPPFRLISLVRQDDPAPSLPNPLRYAGGSQLLRTSPPASPHRYSAPHGFRRLEFSLSPPANRPAAVSGTPSHVPYESQDRAHAAYMPDPPGQ